jgi:glycosyltransferase involved in cell wall biosynthesis
MLDRMEVSKDVFKAQILSPYENLVPSSLSKKSRGSAVKLGFFGSVDYRKGVDLLLDAIDFIKEKNLSLTIVGQLYEDSHENLSIKRRVLNGPNILYYQSQTKVELLSILENIEIIVLPSRVDNMPNTLLESLGMGKIVIGPNAWGFEEMIEDGVNGFLFDVGSKESLINKIEFVLSLSFEVRSGISKKAKEFIDGYSSEYVFQNCLGVYNQCIKISPN